MENDASKTTSNERIRELLTNLNVSQTEFCNATGIKPSALSNYLKGNRIPRQDALSKIADAYNISPTWLMGYDVPMDYPMHTMIVHSEDSEYFEAIIPQGRYEEYVSFIHAADECTSKQVWLAVDMLETFANQNREIEKLKEKDE